jgi:glycosyltransferase involved in cell wall biosynthesis
MSKDQSQVKLESESARHKNVLGPVSQALLEKQRRRSGEPYIAGSLEGRKICVALTAYNENEAIYDAVRNFIDQDGVADVIVVDNNSHDKTSLLAKEAGAHIVREEKQGYGFACIRGLKEALLCENADVIVLAEGDMTFRGHDISKMIPYLDDVDMVVGSRTHKSLCDSDSQLDWFYLWGNLFLAKVLQMKFFDAKFLGKVRLTDVGCTMRAIRRESLIKIIDELTVGGHHFSPHMTLVALKSGLRVIEVPITFRKRAGVSKGAGGNRKLAIKVGLKMLWHIITG